MGATLDNEQKLTGQPAPTSTPAAAQAQQAPGTVAHSPDVSGVQQNFKATQSGHFLAYSDPDPTLGGRIPSMAQSRGAGSLNQILKDSAPNAMNDPVAQFLDAAEAYRPLSIKELAVFLKDTLDNKDLNDEAKRELILQKAKNDPRGMRAAIDRLEQIQNPDGKTDKDRLTALFGGSLKVFDDMKAKAEGTSNSNSQEKAEFDPEKNAAEIIAAFKGSGTGELRTYRAMRGLTKEEAAELREAYKRQTNGGDLDKDMASEFNSVELQYAKALLSAERDPKKMAEADAVGLHLAMKGLGSDEDLIYSILEGMTAEHLERVKEAFKTNYGGDLEKWLDADLDGETLRRAMSYIDAAKNNKESDGAVQSRGLESSFDPVGVASRLRSAFSFPGTDEETALAALDGAYSREEFDKIRGAYNKLSGGRDLDKDMKSEFSAKEMEYAQAIMSRDRVLADAVGLHWAMKGMGTRDATVTRILSRMNSAHYQGVMQEFSRRYPGENLTEWLKGDLSSSAIKKAASHLGL